MTARILHFPPSPQEPIDPGICWTWVIALVLNFAVVIAVAVVVWRMFHG